MLAAREMKLRRIGWIAFAAFLLSANVAAGGTKTFTGQLKSVKDKVLSIQKIGLFSKSSKAVEIEMDDSTKVTGRLLPGMQLKVKYREENGRKIAIEVEAKPYYESKESKKVNEH